MRCYYSYASSDTCGNNVQLGISCADIPVLIFLCLFAFFVRLQKPFFKVFEWFVFTLALHLLIAWIAGFCFFSWRLKEVCVFIMDRILSSTIFLDSLAAPFRLH